MIGWVDGGAGWVGRWLSGQAGWQASWQVRGAGGRTGQEGGRVALYRHRLTIYLPNHRSLTSQHPTTNTQPRPFSQPPVVQPPNHGPPNYQPHKHPATQPPNCQPPTTQSNPTANHSTQPNQPNCQPPNPTHPPNRQPTAAGNGQMEAGGRFLVEPGDSALGPRR